VAPTQKWLVEPIQKNVPRPEYIGVVRHTESSFGRMRFVDGRAAYR
jgi:hypothetical protein